MILLCTCSHNAKRVTKVITNNLSLSVDKTLLSVLDAQTSVSSNKYICSIGFRACCCVYATIKDFGLLGSYLHESEHMRKGKTCADPNPSAEKIIRTGLIDSHSLMSFRYLYHLLTLDTSRCTVECACSTNFAMF